MNKRKEKIISYVDQKVFSEITDYSNRKNMTVSEFSSELLKFALSVYGNRVSKKNEKLYNEIKVVWDELTEKYPRQQRSSCMNAVRSYYRRKGEYPSNKKIKAISQAVIRYFNKNIH